MISIIILLKKLYSATSILNIELQLFVNSECINIDFINMKNLENILNKYAFYNQFSLMLIDKSQQSVRVFPCLNAV